ncbi:hypothetical protein MMC14_009011 [Varicellaria rhodocarpa]|nr:hypothetical protein [Varicellaria rhodocarpa]
MLQQSKRVLSSGYPFVFGFNWYKGANLYHNVDEHGVLLGTPEGEYKGGHAVLAVGYDADKELFLIRNSWGEDWGRNPEKSRTTWVGEDARMSGHFWMPFSWFEKKEKEGKEGPIKDCWVIEVHDPSPVS